MIAMRNILTKLCIFLFFLGITVAVFAQPSGISVQPGDFYRDESDLTARMHPVRNDNAQNCALLKIITTEKDFVFEPDALGMCRDVEYKTAEVWLWLAPGSRRLTIKHPQLGQLRNYEYPLAIESSTVYVMKLTTGKVTTIVQQVNQENFLVLAVTPPEAAVKIDGKMVVTKKGTYQGMYSVGKHHYEAFCDLYHPQQGEFVITPDERTDLKLTLKPNYGWINVMSQPESDAAVYIDGRQVGTTPYKSDKLASGSYTVQVAKDMWQESAREVTVADEKTTTVTLTMNPDFAEPQIVCDDADAEIWVNGEKKGIGRWTGRLAAGAYKIEARRTSHRTASQSVTLRNGDRQTLAIEAPQPIYGKLIVTTEPVGADILLDGKNVGTTPKIVNNVLVGNYELVLKKTGCLPVTKSITIAEGQTVEVSESLPIGRQIVLRSNPTGARLTLDGEYIGTAPQTVTASFGSHRVEAQLGEVRDSQTITVGENGSGEFALNVPQGFQCGGKMKDYDGNEYNTVKIGSQCWMAENMRVTRTRDGKSIAAGSSTSAITPYRYAPNNNTGYVAQYGYLYNWPAATEVCPKGWHLPSSGEFDELMTYCGGHYAVGSDKSYIAKALAAKTGWSSSSYDYTPGNNPSANNASGFSAFPAGGYYGYFIGFGISASFWSATPYGSDRAYALGLNYSLEGAYLDDGSRYYGFSVRCLSDGDNISEISYGTGTRGYIYMPDLTVTELGVVYVEVHISTDGTVVDARVVNNSKYPTTITNSRIQAECVAKAKTAKYKPGKEELRIIVFK
jgi:uncharacterized protein (TIGR02145 family)